MKEYFYEIFENVESPRYMRVNAFYAVVTTVSILALVLETIPALAWLRPFFLLIEYIAFVFFSIEYVGRVLAAPRKREYIFSFFGIIDFLSIFPTIVHLGNFSFLKTARILRLLRFLRLLRVMKLTRAQREESEKDRNRLNFEIYFTALISSIIIFASLIYLVEGYRPEFSHIPIAMIWSSKVVLGGFKVLEPYTISGQLIMIFGRFIGLVLFGLLITVVGGFVKKLLFGREDIHTVVKKKSTKKKTAKKVLKTKRLATKKKVATSKKTTNKAPKKSLAKKE